MRLRSPNQPLSRRRLRRLGPDRRQLVALGGRQLPATLALLHELVVSRRARTWRRVGRQAACPLRDHVAHVGSGGRAAGEARCHGHCDNREQDKAETGWHWSAKPFWRRTGRRRGLLVALNW